MNKPNISTKYIHTMETLMAPKNWKIEDFNNNEELPPRAIFLNYIRGNQDKSETELIAGLASVLGVKPNGAFKIEMTDACYHFSI